MTKSIKGGSEYEKNNRDIISFIINNYIKSLESLMNNEKPHPGMDREDVFLNLFNLINIDFLFFNQIWYQQ